jgi:hypothetical protein
MEHRRQLKWQVSLNVVPSLWNVFLGKDKLGVI